MQGVIGAQVNVLVRKKHLSFFLSLSLAAVYGAVAWAEPLRSPWLDDDVVVDRISTEAPEGTVNDSEFPDNEEVFLSDSLNVDADVFKTFPAELRETFERGLSLNLGVTAPWQTMGMEIHWQHHQWYGTSLALGFGDWVLKGHTEITEYRLDVMSRAAQWGWRYFMQETLPLYLQPAAGVVVWTGDMTPSGVDQSKAEDISFLRAGLRAYGATFGLTLGSMAIWDNGFFIDYSCVGIASSVVLSMDTSATQSSVIREMKAQLTKGQIWGLINIKMGMQF